LTRHERLRRGLDERGCACAVLVGPDHAVHLAGYGRYLSTATAMVVGEDGVCTLVVPRYEVEAAEGHGVAVVGYGDEGFLDFDWRPKLLAACRGLCTGRVGVAGAAMEGAVPIDDLAAEVRRVKDEDEVAAISRSVGLALGAQRRVTELAGEGLSEIELFTAAHAWAQNAALEPVELVGSVFSGPRSAAVAPPVEVQGPFTGSPVVADLAFRVGGYWGDTTRTTPGDSAEAAEAAEAITSILDESGRGLRPGVRACDVFERMRGAIRERFPGGSFAHHAGHSIGVTVAEDPQLIPTQPMELEEGMVFAVEPGVYFPGRFGVRVEDVYEVTADGGVRVAG
jgi:Xaa-Pro dipeptidase